MAVSRTTGSHHGQKRYAPLIRWANSAVLPGISSALLVQVKGFGFSLPASMHVVITSSTARTIPVDSAPQLAGGRFGEPPLDD